LTVSATCPTPHPVTSEAGDHRRALGQSGEDFALAHLQKNGYTLLARNYRTPRGEIDLIAVDGDTLVFLEVKTRLARTLDSRLHSNSLDWFRFRQQARRRPVAVAWLYDGSHPRPNTNNIRLDAVGVLVDPQGKLVHLHHVEGIT
jgi:putative endonuclease